MRKAFIMSNTFLKPVNPDPEHFALSGQSFILRPKQCPDCHTLFTPAEIEQEKCEECSMAKKPLSKQQLDVKRITQLRSYYKRRGNDSKVKELTAKLMALKGVNNWSMDAPSAVQNATPINLIPESEEAELVKRADEMAEAGVSEKEQHSPYSDLIRTARDLHTQLLDQMIPCDINSVQFDKDRLCIFGNGFSIVVSSGAHVS